MVNVDYTYFKQDQGFIQIGKENIREAVFY